MPVNVVITAGNASLTTGNVSLRTVNGSIIDAGIVPDATNVLGQTIDIDANGGSIGEFGNDLDIDSARGPPGLPCVNENCGDLRLCHGGLQRPAAGRLRPRPDQ